MNKYENQWQNIKTLCLSEKSKNPIEIMCKLMDLDFCNIKGHEHHLMICAALLTAYFNAQNEGTNDIISPIFPNILFFSFLIQNPLFR